MISAELIRTIRRQYRLSWLGLHGVTHWARVMENGLRLAKLTGAQPTIVSLFAVFHDAGRQNEDWDPEHGRRGAEFARSLRGSMVTLADDDFDLLHVACADHTEGRSHENITIATCWDADRLDLGRVGVWPDQNYLSTEAAKDPAMIAWAHERSVRRHVPDLVAGEWSIP